MKKILCLLLCLMFCNSVNYVYARDYTKLQEKEMKHAQKYGMNVSNSQYSETHNTKGLLGDYEEIDDKLYQEKLKKDEVEYAKIKEKFETRTIDNYNAEAKGEDYYHIYRIVERLIRANNLDFTNWRIGINRASSDLMAGYSDWNYILISTAFCDTFLNNDSAIAFAIAHVMAHALLGHQERRTKADNRIWKSAFFELTGGFVVLSTFKSSLTEFKNMELSADVEALNLIAKAGYDINDAIEYLKYFQYSGLSTGFWDSTPNIKKRIYNCYIAKNFIPIEEYNKWGKYNIYHSEVLYSELSSDRTSFTLRKNKNSPKLFIIESPEKYYFRCGYGGYINMQYEKSAEYFEKYFKLDTSNPKAYLYAYYTNNELYKRTKRKKYQNTANKYLQKAVELDESVKYKIQQFNNNL